MKRTRSWPIFPAVLLAVLLAACRPTHRPTPPPADPTAADVAGIERVAREVLRIDVSRVEKKGAERNMVGIRTADVLVSRRRDSRTWFVEDARYAKGAYAPLAAPDAALIDETRAILRRLDVPADEMAEATVMTEKLQTGPVDPRTHTVRGGEVRDGKKYVEVKRRIHGVPVFSSRALVGIGQERRVGFMELHWPAVSPETVREAERLQGVVRQGWRPPEQRGARVESVEAGIIHSPAIGFVMDVRPAIRVVYAPTDEKLGRKLMLHLDERGNPVPTPRQFEKLDETPPAPRSTPKTAPRATSKTPPRGS